MMAIQDSSIPASLEGTALARSEREDQFDCEETTKDVEFHIIQGAVRMQKLEGRDSLWVHNVLGIVCVRPIDSLDKATSQKGRAAAMEAGPTKETLLTVAARKRRSLTVRASRLSPCSDPGSSFS